MCVRDDDADDANRTISEGEPLNNSYYLIGRIGEEGQTPIDQHIDIAVEYRRGSPSAGATYPSPACDLPTSAMLQDPPNAIMEDDSKFSAASVEEPHDHDLICGRGGKVNAHPGNRRFRSLVNDRKEAYTRAYGKGEKNAIAQSILQVLFSLNPPGRVLQFDNKNGTYTEVTVKKAMGKTTQALREGEFELDQLPSMIILLPVHARLDMCP